MTETKRRTPAIFDRALGEWQPPPQYIPFPEFEQPPPPASPVIGYRYGQWIGDAVEPLFVRPEYQRFPYFQEPPAAANPVIAYRLGQWLGDAVEPLIGVTARHLPFPYFEQPPPAANPVIIFRYGQLLLDDPTVPISGRYFQYPYSPSGISAKKKHLTIFMVGR